MAQLGPLAQLPGDWQGCSHLKVWLSKDAPPVHPRGCCNTSDPCQLWTRTPHQPLATWAGAQLVTVSWLPAEKGVVPQCEQGGSHRVSNLSLAMASRPCPSGGL